MSFVRSGRSFAVIAAVAGGLALVMPGSADAGRGHQVSPDGLAVRQVNLVSDVPGMAPLLDADLVNPWGLSLGATTPLWVSDNGADAATLYSSAPAAGTAARVSAVKVSMPLPTGQVANAGPGFVISNGTTSNPARFIFSTLTGQIRAWGTPASAPMDEAQIKATVPGAAYTGLAMATAGGGDQLYAANFAQGRIDVFDSTFTQVRQPSWAFRDRSLPRDFAPYNVQTLNGKVFVAYAKPDPITGRSVSGKGLGFVDEYTVDGRFVDRVATRGSLNAPWGMAVAPPSWGPLAGALLIGNFGDGKINIVEPKGHGRFDHKIAGQVRDSGTGRTLVIPYLWALLQGTATTGGTDSLFFTAGLDNETHGLLGVLRKP